MNAARYDRSLPARALLLGVATILVMGVIGASPVSAKQMDAREAPTVTGPLEAGDMQCRKANVTRNDEKLAAVRLCSTLYALDPATDGDEANDYGVLWVQSNVDAKNGWCASRVRTKALVKSGGTLYDVAPGKTAKTSKRQKVRVRLTLDAHENPESTSTLTQRYLLFPRRVKPLVEATKQGTRVTTEWLGSAGRKLAFAMGLELSWPAGIGSPEMSPSMTYKFEKKGSC